MGLFRVRYKSYYREHSEFGHSDILARNELSALRKFFNERRSELREAELLDGAQLPDIRSLDLNSEYRWWEGDWLQVYRGIEKVDAVSCPLCEGKGEVGGAVATDFRERLLSVAS